MPDKVTCHSAVGIEWSEYWLAIGIIAFLDLLILGFAWGKARSGR